MLATVRMEINREKNNPDSSTYHLGLPSLRGREYERDSLIHRLASLIPWDNGILDVTEWAHEAWGNVIENAKLINVDQSQAYLIYERMQAGTFSDCTGMILAITFVNGSSLALNGGKVSEVSFHETE